MRRPFRIVILPSLLFLGNFELSGKDDIHINLSLVVESQFVKVDIWIEVTFQEFVDIQVLQRIELDLFFGCRWNQVSIVDMLPSDKCPLLGFVIGNRHAASFSKSVIVDLMTFDVKTGKLLSVMVLGTSPKEFNTH